MEKLTQTRQDNCWQTCVAMLLNCPAESLPAQHKFSGDRSIYAKALRVYLDKHYGLTYVEGGAEVEPEILKQPIHLMIGETVRTKPDNEVWHAIVGSFGRAYWDVHPSRAGITKVIFWGLLIPTPQEWKSSWACNKCQCRECSSAEQKAEVM